MLSAETPCVFDSLRYSMEIRCNFSYSFCGLFVSFGFPLFGDSAFHAPCALAVVVSRDDGFLSGADHRGRNMSDTSSEKVRMASRPLPVAG